MGQAYGTSGYHLHLAVENPRKLIFTWKLRARLRLRHSTPRRETASTLPCRTRDNARSQALAEVSDERSLLPTRSFDRMIVRSRDLKHRKMYAMSGHVHVHTWCSLCSASKTWPDRRNSQSQRGTNSVNQSQTSAGPKIGRAHPNECGQSTKLVACPWSEVPEHAHKPGSQRNQETGQHSWHQQQHREEASSCWTHELACRCRSNLPEEDGGGGVRRRGGRERKGGVGGEEGGGTGKGSGCLSTKRALFSGFTNSSFTPTLNF